MTNHPTSHYPDIGTIGEDLVTQWLQSKGWIILHRRWRCRWGELDIIAQYNEAQLSGSRRTPTTEHVSFSPILAFVEVKTRSLGNWDAGGRSAIALKKQTKLWRTAEIFLARYPQKSDYTCRFDVAIVHCQAISPDPAATSVPQEALAFTSADGYLLTLQEYIPAAFDSLTANG